MSLDYFASWPSLEALIGTLQKGDDERLSMRALDLPILMAARGDLARALELLEELPPESLFADVVGRLK